jgi:hypothetical protein
MIASCAVSSSARAMGLRSLVGSDSKPQLSPEAGFVTPLIKSAVQGCAAVDVAGGAEGGKWVSYPCVINALGSFDNVALQSSAMPIAQCMSLDGFVIDKDCVMERVQELQGSGPQFTSKQLLTKSAFMQDTDRMWYGLADVQPPSHGPMYGNNQETPQRGALRASVRLAL